MRLGKSIRFRAALRSLAVVVASLAGAGWLHAQGCAMCYNDAAAARTATIQALRSGVLILLFPVLALFIGIFAMAFRSRNRFRELDQAEATENPGATAGESPAWDEPLDVEEVEVAAATTCEI
jgi:hypothetical protein